MLSTLFGKKARTQESNAPWDEIFFGDISIPIWRTRTKDGRARFMFGFSRPFEKAGRKYYARTFDIQNLWDIIGGLGKLTLNLADRDTVSPKDREILLRVHVAIKRALRAESSNGVDVSNGQG